MEEKNKFFIYFGALNKDRYKKIFSSNSNENQKAKQHIFYQTKREYEKIFSVLYIWMDDDEEEAK